MAQTVTEIARTEQYRRYRLDGVSAEDAIARVRSFGAFRRAAISTCSEASRKLTIAA